MILFVAGEGSMVISISSFVLGSLSMMIFLSDSFSGFSLDEDSSFFSKNSSSISTLMVEAFVGSVTSVSTSSVIGFSFTLFSMTGSATETALVFMLSSSSLSSSFSCVPCISFISSWISSFMDWIFSFTVETLSVILLRLILNSKMKYRAKLRIIQVQSPKLPIMLEP